MSFPLLSVGPVEIPNALRQIADDIGDLAELALTDIASDLVGLYQQEIVGDGSVDTAHYLNTVRVRRQARHQRDVGSDAFYAEVVKKKGSGEVIGPSQALNAIARLGPSIESAFNHQLMR